MTDSRFFEHSGRLVPDYRCFENSGRLVTDYRCFENSGHLVTAYRFFENSGRLVPPPGTSHYVALMRIAFALFADAANLSQEGKLNVLGVFDAVQVGQLPTIHPRAHLVARITGSRTDIGAHTMTLTWRSPSGETIWSSNGELRIEQPPAGVEEMDLPFIAALDLPLDRAGTFTLTLDIGGAQMAAVPLQVRSSAPPAGPMIPGGQLVS